MLPRRGEPPRVLHTRWRPRQAGRGGAGGRGGDRGAKKPCTQPPTQIDSASKIPLWVAHGQGDVSPHTHAPSGAPVDEGPATGRRRHGQQQGVGKLEPIPAVAPGDDPQSHPPKRPGLDTPVAVVRRGVGSESGGTAEARPVGGKRCVTPGCPSRQAHQQEDTPSPRRLSRMGPCDGHLSSEARACARPPHGMSAGDLDRVARAEQTSRMFSHGKVPLRRSGRAAIQSKQFAHL